MKDLRDTIYESSKQSLKAAKFEGIPGKELYKELINSILKTFEHDIKNGCDYLSINYEEYMKNANGNKINPQATFIIANWSWIDFSNKDIEQRKWDGKQNVITDEALNEINKLFKEYWDEPVIKGKRQTRRATGITPSGNSHLLQFEFPDGTVLNTNESFGPLSKLLKYATEKEY